MTTAVGQRVDPYRAAVLALVWPAIFVVIGVVIFTVWSCADAIGCLTRSGISQVPFAVAAPTAAALYGAGVAGSTLIVVGSVTSVAVWGSMGWLLARMVGRESGTWRQWWRWYLGLAGIWSALLVGMLGVAALRVVG